jgi:hypothetical protein
MLSMLVPQENENSSSFTHESLEVGIPKGISTWLQARINGCGESGEEGTDVFYLTPHTQEQLRKSARIMLPDEGRKQFPPSLLDRLLGALS